VENSIHSAVMLCKNRSVFVLFCTTTYTCDIDIGSENCIMPYVKTTLFYLGIDFECRIISSLYFKLWLKKDLVQNKIVQVRGCFPYVFVSDSH